MALMGQYHIARALGLTTQQAQDLLSEWIEQGWLEISVDALMQRR